MKLVETRDWREALYSVIPKRKFQSPSAEPSASKDEDEDGEVDNGANDGRSEHAAAHAAVLENVEDSVGIVANTDDAGVDSSFKQ